MSNSSKPASGDGQSDEELLSDLADTIDAVDPVPPAVTQAGMNAFTIGQGNSDDEDE